MDIILANRTAETAAIYFEKINNETIRKLLPQKAKTVEEAVAGVNFPPMHPNCLCIVVAAFARSLFADRKDARPLLENIKFQEWKEKYAS